MDPSRVDNFGQSQKTLRSSRSAGMGQVSADEVDMGGLEKDNEKREVVVERLELKQMGLMEKGWNGLIDR